MKNDLANENGTRCYNFTVTRKRIVFVIPPYPGRDIPDPGGLPLGVLYLAASLPDGWEASIVDGYSIPKTIEDIVTLTCEAKPDAVGFSISFSPQMIYMHELLQGVAAGLPGVITIAGGPHVSFFPGRTLEELPDLGMVISGEGEISLEQVLKGHWDLQGVAYRGEDGIVAGDPPGFANDIDSLPVPDYSLIENRRNYAPRLITSRGCSHNCAFCSSRNFWGGRWRAHSAGRVLDEIERITSFFGNRSISIGDDNFAVDRKRVIDICEGIHSKGLKINFGISAHPDDLDLELLGIMAGAGLNSLFIGIESGRRDIRKKIGKDFDEDNLHKILAARGKNGVSVHASFMLGIPGENEESMQATLDYAEDLDVDSLGFHMFNPLPGSPMANAPEKYGFVITSDDYADMAIDTHYRIMAPSLHSVAVLDYYYRGRALASARQRKRNAD